MFDHLQESIGGNTPNGLRICKGTKHKHHPMQAQRREAHLSDKSRPRREENKRITEAKSLQLRAKPPWAKPRGSQEATQWSWAVLDEPLVRPHPTCSVWPKVWSVDTYRLAQRQCQGMARFNEPKGRFCTFHVGIKHIPWIIPSSPL